MDFHPGPLSDGLGQRSKVNERGRTDTPTFLCVVRFHSSEIKLSGEITHFYHLFKLYL